MTTANLEQIFTCRVIYKISELRQYNSPNFNMLSPPEGSRATAPKASGANLLEEPLLATTAIFDAYYSSFSMLCLHVFDFYVTNYKVVHLEVIKGIDA